MKVEEILKLAENTIADRKAEIEKQKEEAKELHRKLVETLMFLDVAFRGAEYPDPKTENPSKIAEYQTGFEKIKVEGETILHPFNPNSELWIIQRFSLWHVITNGEGEADLTKNNVILSDGTVGIGRRKSGDAQTVGFIRDLKNK